MAPRHRCVGRGRRTGDGAARDRRRRRGGRRRRPSDGRRPAPRSAATRPHRPLRPGDRRLSARHRGGGHRRRPRRTDRRPARLGAPHRPRRPQPLRLRRCRRRSHGAVLRGHPGPDEDDAARDRRGDPGSHHRPLGQRRRGCCGCGRRTSRRRCDRPRLLHGRHRRTRRALAGPAAIPSRLGRATARPAHRRARLVVCDVRVVRGRAPARRTGPGGHHRAGGRRVRSDRRGLPRLSRPGHPGRRPPATRCRIPADAVLAGARAGERGTGPRARRERPARRGCARRLGARHGDPRPCRIRATRRILHTID